MRGNIRGGVLRTAPDHLPHITIEQETIVMKHLNHGSMLGICSVIVFSALMLLAPNGYASDLDDGIEIDKDINDDLKLDNSNQYIITKAKTNARASQKGKGGGGDVIAADGTGNIAIGAGVNLKGATIINLSDNEGATVLGD